MACKTDQNLRLKRRYIKTFATLQQLFYIQRNADFQGGGGGGGVSKLVFYAQSTGVVTSGRGGWRENEIWVQPNHNNLVRKGERGIRKSLFGWKKRSVEQEVEIQHPNRRFVGGIS